LTLTEKASGVRKVDQGERRGYVNNGLALAHARWKSADPAVMTDQD
jgi:hypothetical protein